MLERFRARPRTPILKPVELALVMKIVYFIFIYFYFFFEKNFYFCSSKSQPKISKYNNTIYMKCIFTGSSSIASTISKVVLAFVCACSRWRCCAVVGGSQC